MRLQALLAKFLPHAVVLRMSASLS